MWIFGLLLDLLFLLISVMGHSEIRKKLFSNNFHSVLSIQDGLSSNVSIHTSGHLQYYSRSRKRAALKFPVLTFSLPFTSCEGHFHCFQFLSSLHFSFPHSLLFFFPSGVSLHDTSTSNLTLEHVLGFGII